MAPLVGNTLCHFDVRWGLRDLSLLSVKLEIFVNILVSETI
jgi:hypothetical protein